MTSGANVTAVGIITVFLALILLIAVVSLVHVVVERLSPTPAADTTDAVQSTAGATTDERSTLAAVAIAAYALHQARRVTVAAPAPSSYWQREGRSRQLTQHEKRH